MQWISHCVQLQIDSVGVFCLGSGPIFGVWFVFCCLLRCFRWRNASLAGGFAGRRFWWLWFPFCWLHRFAYFKDFFVLVQSLVCLLTCKDRAISATSATLEEKKSRGYCDLNLLLSVSWSSWVGRMSRGFAWWVLFCSERGCRLTGQSHGPGCAAVSLIGAIQWCSL